MDTNGNVVYRIADVEGKRKRDTKGQYRNVRPRADAAPVVLESFENTAMMDVEQLQPSRCVNQPPTMSGGTVPITPRGSTERTSSLLRGVPNASDGSTTTPIPPMDYTGSSASSAKVLQLTKYHLRSDFQEQVMDRFEDEIMDQPLRGVTMWKLMGVSNEFNDWVCEHGRRKRRLIEATANVTEGSIASANAVTVGPLYACLSGHARVMLNHEIEISDALLDNGSEVNLMPEWIFKQTTFPIDTEIDWKIASFDFGATPERNNVLGVCHDIPVSVGGVEERIHIFVVRDSAQKLLLG